MSTTRRFCCDDLLKFNNINLDVLTETYNMPFYLQYLTTWPEYFLMKESPDGTPMGYIMGKAEGQKELWHGHVTAVTVAPEYRRLGVAKQLMGSLETVSEHVYNAFFVDLFVRVSNTLAINMYNAFGYSVYRRVIGYYSGEEDAFDMRKALPRDRNKKSVVPLSHPVMPEDLEWRSGAARPAPMAERGTGARWHGAAWGPRARTLAFVVTGVIVAGAGIAYLRRRDRNQQKQEQSKSVGGRGTADATEKDEQGDVEEAGIAAATSGEETELDSSASETSEVKAVSPAAKDSAAEISFRPVHVERKFRPIALGLSSVALPLGTAPREIPQQERVGSGGAPPVAAATVTNDSSAGGLANEGLYLTSSGINQTLLKLRNGEGAVGGFGEVTFWETTSGQEFALKTAKDTASGRRQQRREIEFFMDFKRLHPDAANIVGVVEARTDPFDMLLMRKESMSLTGMLESAITIDVGAVAKALFGVLAAIDLLHEAGFIQRDIKGDNILIGKDGRGILADFGLCIARADACLPEFLGDGTTDYAAPEICSKLSGSTLCTELYSWFVVFVEAVMMRHPFAGEQLFDARTDRLEYLDEKRTYMIEDLDDATEQLGNLLAGEEERRGGGGGEGGGGRLGVRSPRRWKPSAADKAVLTSLGEPLSFFRKGRMRNELREEMASGEAKANPSRLFEGDDWVEWLPGPSRADCKQGVRLAVDLVLKKGGLDPYPESRPQSVDAARGVLAEAVALYEQQSQMEMEFEQDDGATGEDSGAGG
eukprot:g19145.t1